MATIVPIYAAILGLIFVVLSFRVANTRKEMQIGIGAGGNPVLERRIRVQGNFAEYVPIILILMTFIELQGWPKWLVHLLCVLTIVSRLVHAYGVAQTAEDIRLRASAMIVTFGIISTASLVLLAGAIMRAG
jgi:uncharacterized membrane protein YecN with MAPEG domain